MRLHHFAALSTLVFALMLLPAPAAAQPEIVPFGPAVDVDEDQCTYAAVAIETEGQVVVVWYRSFNPQGIFARTGPSLAELGPERLLADARVAQQLRVAPQPGGFVVAWNSESLSNSFALFQRFGLDLAPIAPVVSASDAMLFTSPALLVDPDGVVTIANFDGEDLPRVRRYSAADAPLTPSIVVDGAIPATFQPLIRLAAGDGSFLVAWSGVGALWTRAFGWDGVPASPTIHLALIALHDFDVAWAAGRYLVVHAFNGVTGHAIGANGQPLGPDVQVVASANGPYALRLSSDGESLWLGAAIYQQGLVGTRIAMPEATAAPFETLVPWPTGESEFLEPTGLTTTPDGFLLAWRFGMTSNILPPPCIDGLAVRSQAFGPPRGVVDVPALSAAGLIACALLCAAAGLFVLRRS